MARDRTRDTALTTSATAAAAFGLVQRPVRSAAGFKDGVLLEAGFDVVTQ